MQIENLIKSEKKDHKRNLNYNHINKHIITYIHLHTLHSLKHSQCCVGAQSLGKRTRSFGANLAIIETGAGGGRVWAQHGHSACTSSSLF